MKMSVCALGLALGVVATFAPHLALADSGVATEDAASSKQGPNSQQTVNSPKDPGVSKRSNEKIGMVTATLKDILQSVVNEEVQETSMFNKYTKWCKTQSAAIANDISETNTELGNARVLSEEQISNIDGLKLFITKNEKEIEETKDAIAQAVTLRNEENDEYTEEMQMNTQSLRQIDLAIKHVGKVGKQGGFLQNGAKQRLQINLPGESSYVSGIMKGLKEKLEKSRAVLKKVEGEKVNMHNSFMNTKGQSLKALTDTTTDKKILLTETTARQAGVNQKISKLTDEVAKLGKSAAETDESCQTTKTEWKERQVDRIKEKGALAEAIRFLTETSFEQVSRVQDAEDDAGEEQASVVFAPSFLQTDEASEDREFDAAVDAEYSGADVQIHMQKDTFNGVKGVVAKLIASHQDTQKEEKTKRDYCEKEIESKEDEKEEATNDLAAVKAGVEKKASEVEMLADEITKLYASIAQTRKGVKDAGDLRKQEAAVFRSGSKDRALAVKVLSQAIAVLQRFYDAKQASLLQGSGHGQAAVDAPPEKWSNSSPRKSTSSFGAVSMVQDIADDIAKEQKDATIQEKHAAEAFAKLQADSQEATDDKQQDITDRVMAKAKLGVQINTLKETQTEKSDDLDAINKQLVALHEECDELLQFYGKRKKSRAFEVDQLNDVMDVLSGSSLAVRTGFLQANAGSQTAEPSSEPSSETADTSSDDQTVEPSSETADTQ